MKAEGKKRNESASREGVGGKDEEYSAPLPEVYETAWLQLLRASSELAARVERDLEENTGGVTLAEFDVLNALSDTNGKAGREGRLTVSELTKFTRLSRSTVSRLVDQMERTSGYVRKRNKDGKAVWVEIMPAGRTAMKTTFRPAWERAVRTHFANFISERIAGALADILTRMGRGGTDEIDENTS